MDKQILRETFSGPEREAIEEGLTEYELHRLAECLEALKQEDPVKCALTMLSAGLNPASWREVTEGKDLRDVLNRPPNQFEVSCSILNRITGDCYRDDAIAASAYCAVMTHDLLSGDPAIRGKMRSVQLYIARRQTERQIRSFLDSKGQWRSCCLTSGRLIVPPPPWICDIAETAFYKPRRWMEEAHHHAFFSLHDPQNVEDRVRSAIKEGVDASFEREYYEVVKMYSGRAIRDHVPERQDVRNYVEMFSDEGREEEDGIGTKIPYTYRSI